MNCPYPSVKFLAAKHFHAISPCHYRGNLSRSKMITAFG